MPGHSRATTTSVFVLSFAMMAPAPAWARSAGPEGQSQAASPAPAEADSLRPRPIEPDYRLINLPTTVPLPRLRSNFQLTHRFGGNLRRGDFGFQASNLFGIDQGAFVGFEYRLAVARRLQAAVYRVTLDKTFQFHGQYNAVRQDDSMPLSLSAVVSIEGADNFQRDRAPALGAVASRAFADRVAVYVAPVWVHNTAAVLGLERDTVFMGLGGRVRVRPSVYLVGEISPRLSGYAPSQPEFGFGVEKRMGGHVFQVNVTNTSGTTLGQTARGGAPESLYLGFNLSRKFF
jgi:hypothetical protein